jgi:hypothetical protein
VVYQRRAAGRVPVETSTSPFLPTEDAGVRKRYQSLASL